MTMKPFDYDNIADRYDQLYLDPVFVEEDRIVQEWMNPYIYVPVLDLGCGTGKFLELFPTLPPDYLGVDISKKMIDQAIAKFPRHEFLCMDVNEFSTCKPWGKECWKSIVALYNSLNYIVKEHQIVSFAVWIRTLLVPGASFQAVIARDLELPVYQRLLESCPKPIIPQPRCGWSLQEIHTFGRQFYRYEIEGIGVQDGMPGISCLDDCYSYLFRGFQNA